ncbi:MAG: aminotransferase class I/II-fold pyridoxal phosphate-dependent enzyme [Gemmatimonadetes bacterium]|nr:aminotransferase class I/II-fold pyridoxal phosphate-dependent enzyme [Gemmatimonadota bacterium]MYH19316.1 aminotransferase class I/II-fold pyridoxal phosphate-dependent enzyme [Gemmatimonadota bacterium]MYK97911.1 aminotransferase class I/II-fold pyridoxal phosphate-dependent enzyme [Gemmatimonadota bacterium]
MKPSFGAAVLRTAEALSAQGKDANQIAKFVCDQDPDGYNYGIGIVVDGKGRAWPTSETLLNHARAEIDHSLAGEYMSTASLSDPLKEAVLRWQRIPEDHWGRFSLLIPSDAGTGAVKTAVEMALQLYPDLQAIGVEELSWPAYKAIARMSRIACREFPIGDVMDASDLLRIYQAGPMNTTGRVQSLETMNERASASKGRPVLLDRAYSGFEYARLLDSHGYDEIMAMSYDDQIRPFIENDVPFWISVSPTKSFGTFALRPCGMLLVHLPDASRSGEVAALSNTVTRARGSSFEHPVTRAFVSALVNDLASLEREHADILRRVAAAEQAWKDRCAGSPLSELFTDRYAGLFRNPRVEDEAQAVIYDAHLYPVFTPGRCRLNVTGLPEDEDIAGDHVKVFARFCRG